jgi:hypothetical protein
MEHDFDAPRGFLNYFGLRDVSLKQLDFFSDSLKIVWIAGAEVIQDPNFVPGRQQPIN